MWTCPQCGEQIEDQFDSCWKCAGRLEPANPPVPRLKSQFFVFAALMSAAAVALADLLQSMSVYNRGIRFYQAVLWDVNPRFWCGAGIQTAFSFLILWFLARLGFSDRIIWIGLVILWTTLAFASEAVCK